MGEKRLDEIFLFNYCVGMSPNEVRGYAFEFLCGAQWRREIEVEKRRGKVREIENILGFRIFPALAHSETISCVTTRSSNVGSALSRMEIRFTI